MALTKIKKERVGADLENARAKLDDVLHSLLEKARESPTSSEDDSNKISAEIIIKKEPSPVSSPAKKTQRTQRKRRRKDEVAVKSSNTCVMKLFDRAVDLAPFTEQTPLYPICRAWINNQPHQIPVKSENTGEQHESLADNEKVTDEQESLYVYQLPPAPPYKGDIKELRIPSPVPQPQEEFIICSDEQNSLTKEHLMAKHMTRWRAVRQKWKQAAQANEERYKESKDILKSIFDRSQCRDAVLSDQWDTMTPVS